MSLIYLTRGDSRILDLTATTPADLPYNLTNTTLTFMVKRGYDDADADAVISKTMDNGVSITDAAGGLASIFLSADDTANLRPDASYVYDIQAVDGDDVATLDTGSIRVLPDVTRATA